MRTIFILSLLLLAACAPQQAAQDTAPEVTVDGGDAAPADAAPAYGEPWQTGDCVVEGDGDVPDFRILEVDQAAREYRVEVLDSGVATTTPFTSMPRTNHRAVPCP